jgi:hypothetical protein
MRTLAQPSRVAPAAALTATLAGAAVCWVVAVRQMEGMNMGASTELGSLSFFVGTWVVMMAAMMLPGAGPAVMRRARAGGRLAATPFFAALYLAVWTLFGLGVYALYRPHAGPVAGALTPRGWSLRADAAQARLPTSLSRDRWLGTRLRNLLRRLEHRTDARAGRPGPHERHWMAVVGGLVLAQKLVPPHRAVDVPLALALVGLGIATVL